ncbi:hypothetical protein LguiA_001491 [Lonicera macranthoides]
MDADLVVRASLGRDEKSIPFQYIVRRCNGVSGEMNIDRDPIMVAVTDENEGSVIKRQWKRLTRPSPQFSEYNIKEHTKRCTIDVFCHNKYLPGPSSVSAAFSDSITQLQVAKRQSVV